MPREEETAALAPRGDGALSGFLGKFRTSGPDRLKDDELRQRVRAAYLDHLDTTFGFFEQLRASALEKTLPVFVDIAKQAGVADKIICGDKVTEYLIDVNGQGAAFLDYDNDGDQDIYLVNGSSREAEMEGQPPHDYLLRNNGVGPGQKRYERGRKGHSKAKV